MTTAYLGVGSNLGDREANVNHARSLLEKTGISVKRTSPAYETDALCRPNETMPRFLNAVFEVETLLNPEILLWTVEAIEKTMGRTEKGNWKPRVIDLDILFYGDEVFESKRLKIPHPEIERRWFVLKPLMDLAPALRHPILKKTVKEMLSALSAPDNSSS